MDLNDLWQNHKRFILGVAGGGLVFLVGLVVIDSNWSVATAKAGIAGRSRDILKLEAPSTGDLSSLGAECSRLSTRLDDLYKKMSVETRPDFVVPANDSADLFYNKKRDEEQDKLVREARRRNINVKASLGLPEFTPSGTEAIQRSLRALDVVDQVVSAALEANVRGVDEIEVRDLKSGSKSKANAFLDALAVKFTITGSTASIAALIDRLTRAESSFLAIEDAEIETDVRRQNLTVLRLTAAILAIHPENQLTESRK